MKAIPNGIYLYSVYIWANDDCWTVVEVTPVGVKFRPGYAPVPWQDIPDNAKFLQIEPGMVVTFLEV